QGVDVLFSSCAHLTGSLNAARAAGGYERKLATLARVPLLVIDSCYEASYVDIETSGAEFSGLRRFSSTHKS
ncbi:MAG: istB-like binding family protein, partial [Gammaproteobacteria bacterium]|nr:istB-like binding family protein [Gammaproteobacteria bacterium]